jgi:hypothetical protein
MSNRFLVLSVVFLFSTVACGGSGNSPTAPGPSGSTGASITGSVLSGASSAMTAGSTGQSIPGLTVTVSGTSIASGLDATGRFHLTGVPSGDIQLQFSGPASGTIPVSGVKPTESITLVVSVSSSSVTLESAARTGAGDEELEGRIESLPPTMAAGSLKVAGRTVTTNSSTQIRHGSTPIDFDDLEIGYRVHVKGSPSGSNLLASTIIVQNTITTIPVNVNGIIDDLSGDEDAFQFEIGSRLIKGDDDTEFFGNGGADSFEDLEDGVRVEVKGLQRDGYIYAERIHIDKEEEEEEDEEQDESASIHGKLMSIGGTSPSLQLVVGTTTVRTSSSTVVRRRGDVQTLAELRVGMDLHVVGDRQSDGSLDARMIQINDDEAGAEAEIQGAAGGVSGTCPNLTFGVNGYTVKTNGSTTFTGGTCATMKSGLKVKVKGISQADNSILATSVER